MALPDKTHGVTVTQRRKDFRCGYRRYAVNLRCAAPSGRPQPRQAQTTDDGRIQTAQGGGKALTGGGLMSRNYTPAQKAEIQKRLDELVRNPRSDDVGQG